VWYGRVRKRFEFNIQEKIFVLVCCYRLMEKIRNRMTEKNEFCLTESKKIAKVVA